MINIANLQEIPVDIVGSNKFGRYPKINDSETVNMIISDGKLVPYAGYKKVSTIAGGQEGRGTFTSFRYGHMIRVVDEKVYIVTPNLESYQIGSLQTFSGDVFIAENNLKQIGICDKRSIYIFNWGDNSFKRLDLDFIPTYLSALGNLFLATVENSPACRFSDSTDGEDWPVVNEIALETKSSNALAIFPFPGRGNVIAIMGQSVTEIWSFTGAALTPFQKNEYLDIDYGCINSSTVSFSDDFVVWVGINEKSGVTILYSDGSTFKQISTDGINFVLARLTNPNNSHGFLFKQDGHLIYQFTFQDDNISYIYDFNSDAFFTVTGPDLGTHPASDVVAFNNRYYFSNMNDGDLYEFSTAFTDLDGEEIPRSRITSNVRAKDSKPFIGVGLDILMESGSSSNDQRVDLSLSKDGGESFGNKVGITMKPIGKRQNMINFWNFGRANDLTFQVQWWGKSRFVVGNGMLRYYQ